MLASAGLFLGVGWTAIGAAMVPVWVVQRRIRNAAIVDVAWAYAVGALAIAFAIAGPGWTYRRALIATLMGVWSVRLGTFLLKDRVLGRDEEGRYRELRRAWGTGADRRFFWLFQAQALAAGLFALPALVPAFNSAEALSSIEIAAVLLWACAFMGETTADHQLAQFKADPTRHGRTCQVGLWRYSRHPNYFFEWLMWVAYALFAAASPGGAIAFVCPLAMLYLLFKVTGIPATEAQALRTRGDEYRRYQQTTSVFVPWFNSANHAAANS